MLLDLTTTSLVEWSRWQFAMTAIYHYMFVPLTLGLALMLAIMETMWVKTGDQSWLNATKFWMKLFGINFAIGVATGLILEFHELVELFLVRRGHFRRPACYRRYHRLLPRIDIRGSHVLRLEQSR